VANGQPSNQLSNQLSNQPIKSGYEFQYFIDPDRRKKGIGQQLRARVEQYFKEQEVAFAYAFIVDGNLPSMSLFEKQGFSLLKKLKMQVLLPYRKMPLPAGTIIRPATAGDYPAIATLLNRTWQDYNLYRPVTAEGLAAQLAHLPEYQATDLFVLEEGGEITACVGTWDWQKITRLKAVSLTFSLTAIGKTLDLLRLVRPMPRLPKPGQVFKQWCLLPVAFKDIAALKTMLYFINNQALEAGIEQLVNMCDPACPAPQAMQGLFKANSLMQMYIKPLKPGFALDERPVYVNPVDM
jgi:N-acetylglutamate synthase-like GNAT family acetyltransferase